MFPTWMLVSITACIVYIVVGAVSYIQEEFCYTRDWWCTFGRILIMLMIVAGAGGITFVWTVR